MFQVLTSSRLFTSITAFSFREPNFVHQLIQALVCASETYEKDSVVPQDVALWQNAIRVSDRKTLEAFHALSLSKVVRSRLVPKLAWILSYAVLHTKDLKLLDWIDSNFTRDVYNSLNAVLMDERIRVRGRQRC